MPDISEVLGGVVNAVAAALYPLGTTAPSATGAPVRVFPGWPDPKALDDDLAKGVVNVSVFPRNGMFRGEARYSKAWTGGSIPLPSMTARASGPAVTFEGIGSAGLLGAVVDGHRSWPLQILAGQTAAQVAAAFAALIAADRPATASGPILTLPGAAALKARCVAPVTEARELRRQTQGLQITIWAPSPELRDRTAAEIDIWLAGASYLTVQGYAVRLQFTGSVFDDDARQARLHRRDLMLSAEFPTVQSRTSPAVSIPIVDYQTADGDPLQTIIS